MQKRFGVGIDFGTLSARAILVDTSSGEVVESLVYAYQDGVIDQYLPGTNIALPSDYALQNPNDYVNALEGLLSDIHVEAGIPPEEIVSIGIAFTSCTVLPVDTNMLPLCNSETHKTDPHSWVKLWKHHGAQRYADLINSKAHELNEEFIGRYGGLSSSEWYFAKLLEIFFEAKDIYRATYKFLEAGDWLVGRLTGNYITNSCMAGFKAFWDKETGFPSNHFFSELDHEFGATYSGKMPTIVKPIGSSAGGLTKEFAKKTGLVEGTAVAVSVIDAHAAFPAAGNAESSSMVIVMGTSLCHISIGDRAIHVPGISGVVSDGILPGFFGYEAGQPAAGDIMDWFVTRFHTQAMVLEAEARNIPIIELMNEKASLVQPGSSGLVTLDWWNGNRSILNDSNLSGVIVGLTLNTTPEEIFRSIMEAIAYGTRVIIENYEHHGIQVNEVFACGGLARKSKLMMQILSDVLQKPIRVSSIEQTTAYGAALYGLSAAGSAKGGFDSLFEAMEIRQDGFTDEFKPNTDLTQIYNRLFKSYVILGEYFGKQNKVMMEELGEFRDTAFTTNKQEDM